jgi:hypothetical protein
MTLYIIVYIITLQYIGKNKNVIHCQDLTKIVLARSGMVEYSRPRLGQKTLDFT